MNIGKLKITASRWPWQSGSTVAPLNPFGARFGAGWKYKLGIDIGSTTVLLNLLYGIIRISWQRD